MIKGKRAIVTGASRGIGFAIAKALADKGLKVVITGRNPKTLDRAKDAIGENVIPLVWDASDVALTEKNSEKRLLCWGGSIFW